MDNASERNFKKFFEIPLDFILPDVYNIVCKVNSIHKRTIQLFADIVYW